MTNEDSAWRPERTKPEHAEAFDEEFCGYNACRHHMDSHDYEAERADKNVPCTECPEGLCVR